MALSAQTIRQLRRQASGVRLGCPGYGSEVRPAIPTLGTLAHQTQVSLIDEGRGAESMVRALAPHIPARKGVQILVHQRNQFAFGIGITPFTAAIRPII